MTTTNSAEPMIEMILAEEGHLRRIARRFARCDADVDDLVQDTLMRAYKARDRFIPGTSIRAWMSTILRRVFLTGAIRTKRRGVETDTDADEPLERAAGVYAPSNCETTPQFADYAEDLDERLKAALERVPEVYRIPFCLQTMEELSCGEIARILGVAEGTVMSRIYRARHRLRAALAEFDGRPAMSEPTTLRKVEGPRSASRALRARFVEQEKAA